MLVATLRAARVGPGMSHAAQPPCRWGTACRKRCRKRCSTNTASRECVQDATARPTSAQLENHKLIAQSRISPRPNLAVDVARAKAFLAAKAAAATEDFGLSAPRSSQCAPHLMRRCVPVAAGCHMPQRMHVLPPAATCCSAGASQALQSHQPSAQHAQTPRAVHCALRTCMPCTAHSERRFGALPPRATPLLLFGVSSLKRHAGVCITSFRVLPQAPCRRVHHMILCPASSAVHAYASPLLRTSTAQHLSLGRGSHALWLSPELRSQASRLGAARLH
jgi:hypothetical protein